MRSGLIPPPHGWRRRPDRLKSGTGKAKNRIVAAYGLMAPDAYLNR
jgi:hypothetical protein